MAPKTTTTTTPPKPAAYNPYSDPSVIGAGDLGSTADTYGYKDVLGESAVLGGRNPRNPFQRGSFLQIHTSPGGFLPRGVTGGTGAEHSFNEMMGALSTMTPDELEDLQRRLYFSGAYDDGFYKDGRKPTGLLDGETLQAYMNVLTIASREVGRNRTMADVLDSMAVDRADVVNQALEGGTGADESFPTASVSVSDPAAIEDLADKLSREVLGKKATAAERKKIVAAIQGSQIFEQTKSINAVDANRQRTADAKAGQPTGAAGAGEGTFNARMAEFEAAAKEAGLNIKIGSGKRTHQEQARLYMEKPTLAAPPGKSNHEFGLAADLVFGNDAARKWAHANAARFGLTFPMLGEKGGKNEPWHIELIDAKAQRNTADYDTVTRTVLPGSPSLHGDSTLEPMTVTSQGAVTGTAGAASGPTTVNPTQVVSETQVDPNARIEDMIRATNPTLAAAHDTANTYAMFLRVMGIGGQS